MSKKVAAADVACCPDVLTRCPQEPIDLDFATVMIDASEVTRIQMDQTRSDLSEKLNALENQVSNTMTSVRDAADTVNTSLDFRRPIQEHPLLALGGSVVAGFLAERMLHRTIKPPVAVTERPVHPIPENKTPQTANLLASLENVVQMVAIQSLPLVLDFVLRQWNESAAAQPTNQSPTSAPPPTQKILEAKRRAS